MNWRYILFSALLSLILLPSSVAEAAPCRQHPSIARTPSDGSPWAQRGVTLMETQTSDNVAVTGGCVDATLNGVIYAAASFKGAVSGAFCAWDSTHDVGDCINNAISTVNAAGGGTVMVPAGTYGRSVTITLLSNVNLVGAGPGKTIIKQLDGTNNDSIKSSGADALWGTLSTGGITEFSISNMTIDGNRDNNSSAGSCLSIYGYHYTAENLTIKNCRDYGWRTEWGPAGVGPMEAHFSNIFISGTGKTGWWMAGPHDSVGLNVIVTGAGDLTDNTYDGILVDTYGGSRFVGVHSYASNATNKAKYALRVLGNGANFSAGNYEGAKTANVYVGANYTTFDSSNAYYAVLNGGTNILIAKAVNTIRGIIQPPNSGASAGLAFVGGAGNDPSNNLIDLLTVSQTTCAVDFTNSAGNNTIKVRGYAASGPAYCGTPSATDQVDIDVAGGASPRYLKQVAGAASFLGVTSFTDTTNSSSISTGAVLVSGGLGVAKTLYASTLVATPTTGAANLTVGSLQASQRACANFYEAGSLAWQFCKEITGGFFGWHQATGVNWLNVSAAGTVQIGEHGGTSSDVLQLMSTNVQVPNIFSTSSNQSGTVCVNTSTGVLSYNANNACTANGVKLPAFTVATLPACNASTDGFLVRVTDANAPTYNGALTGSSTTMTLALCINGTGWRAH